ncbi:hypothetical protein LIER_12232 [Lithospermum erythrorhizon]|uniref:Uncharacterized protein n=1 Tax=Lithospermum erythrorhizon TaxID=34254 RepID=A0AAV3PTD3_LITER
MAYNRVAYGLTCYLGLLILLQQINFAASTRASKLLHPPQASLVASSMIKAPPPPSSHSVVFNRYKKMETDAFRPTSPGHSPGMGHESPPGSH